MKNLILSLFLALFSTLAFSMDKCMTGAWYDPERSGEGIELVVLDTSVYGYMYTYRDLDVEWFVFTFNEPEVEKGTLWRSVKVSNSPWAVGNHDVGDVDVVVQDNDNMLFFKNQILDLTSDASIPWCFTDCQREYPFVRLTQPIPCTD